MPFDAGVFVGLGMRGIARALLSKIDVSVEGLENVPTAGPALVVCKHRHHLYDGAVLVSAIRRPVRTIVGLDWVKDRRQRACMEMICAVAGWPVVLRDESGGNPWGGGYRPSERRRYARAALSRTTEMLRRGELLAMFPEGYPEIDPAGPAGERAAFHDGYLSIALRAARHGVAVPLVPAGLSYAGPAAKPTAVTLRFGPAECVASVSERAAAGRKLEAAVRALSA